MKANGFKLDNQNHKNIPVEYKLMLYWFQKYVKDTDFDKEDYLKTELNTSTIDKFNECVSSFEELFNTDKGLYDKPIKWDNRKTCDNFFEKLQKGCRFEEYVSSEFKNYGVELGMQYNEYQWHGENLFGLEIKNDEVFKETGNLYIEYYERHDVSKSWNKTGILKEDNTKVFLIGTYDNYFIVLKDVLIDVYNRLKQNDPEISRYCRFAETNDKTAKGFLIKKSYMKKICLSQSIKEFVKMYVKDNKLIEKVIVYKNCNGSFFHSADKKFCLYRPRNPEIITLTLSEAFIKGYRPCTCCFKGS